MAQISDIQGNNDLLLLIFLFPLLYFIFKLVVKSWFSSSYSPRIPPGPIPWPIIGNIFDLAGGKMLHITLCNLAQKYGPLVSLKLGTQYLVIGSSPSAAMEILKIHDKILSAHRVPSAAPATQAELNQASIFWTESCNDRWKFIRTVLRNEMLSGKVLESHANLREKKIMEMVVHLRANEGQEVKVKEVVYATVFNMMSNILLSRDLLGFQDDELADGGLVKGLLKRLTEIVSAPNVSDFYPVLSILDLQGLRKKSKELAHRVQAIWDPIIEEKRKGVADSLRSQDFVDSLISNGYTNGQINQLLMELFNAGTDTSTTTIEWTMAELMRNPKSLMKVREEIGKEISEDFPKESYLMQLPYLQACVKETLRLHPPVPFLLPHRAIESCQVLSYTIPKNAQIITNVWAIGRDPSFWDEPLKFEPERFVNSAMEFKGNEFEFLPFGSGRRMCPGLPLAARIVPLFIASLIHFFNWSLPHGNNPEKLDMNEKLDATLQMNQPLVLIPTARK
ncbi:hypothetical protein ACH5RR_038498 [Cinchona calisaya]|uniref:(S)-N-methylcoclaurine 3'-hydroxylase isozyme 2 n=1 Tax=Cinchona calisaya TaxID=153742 RepID=A0ABD2Y0X0_9GENT